MTTSYGRIFSEEKWGATFSEVTSLSDLGNVFVCHTIVADLEKIALELSNRVIDRSWVADLDNTAKRAYQTTALRTAQALVEILKTKLSEDDKIASEFGELMVSMGSSKALEVVFGLYVSKNSIYQGRFRDGFEDYISGLPELTDEGALNIIENIRHIIGANVVGHDSHLVNLLKKGVVIHHGSIPLEVRFLIEDFIRNKYSTLCFATSTLAQGINMPFDIVWLESNRFDGNENERALAFKNLIGRAGRLTPAKVFDYGYVYTNNAKLFSKRIQTRFTLNDQSILETPPTGEHENDQKELIQAIQNDTFDDEKNIPKSKLERLSDALVLLAAKQFLDIFYSYPNDLRRSIGGAQNRNKRDDAKLLLKTIYEASLGRNLFAGEENVFNQAIDIFFHAAQGRSFSEIVGLRYSSITNRDDPNNPYASFSQPAKKLPDSSLVYSYSLFPVETPKRTVSYDSIIYDTYDYMDQVISFSLSDVFVAAFQIYHEKNGDDRANEIIELFRYNTNNDMHILLLRYGFPPEMVKDMAVYVENIDEARIIFLPTIANAPDIIQKLVKWYLPL